MYAESHQFSFSEKRWTESLREFVEYLYAEWSTFLAAVISLWAIAEVIATAVGGRVPTEQLAVPVLGFALAVAMYRAYRKQVTYIPEALSSEAAAVSQIFRTQRCGWNAALAREMLLDRLRSAEATLERIKRGSEYIEPRQIEVDDYVGWLKTRPEAMRRLVRAAMSLCTQELPAVIGRTTSEEDLARLRDEVDALAEVYSSARDLEVECHELVPPAEFQHIHEMTHGWTDTIREGVRRFCDILDEIARIDRKSLLDGTVSPPSFEIVIGSPENLDEFCNRLDTLEE